MTTRLVVLDGRAVFVAGLKFGLLAVSLTALLALAWRRIRRDPLPIGGLLLVVVGVFALAQRTTLPDGLVYGLAALAGGGLVAGLLPASRVVGIVLAVPGAWLLASRADLVDVEWIRVVVGTGIVIGAVLVADFDRRWRAAGFPPVLVAISAAGVYVTVPETGPASALLGAALPLALLGWPRALAGLGSAGAFAATGFVVWTIAVGGFPRASSIVGGLACLGLLVVEPIARALTYQGRSMLDLVAVPGWGAIPVAAGHLILVIVSSRLAGLQSSVRLAVLIVVVELCLALVALLAGAAVLLRNRSRPTLSGYGGRW